MRRFRTVVTTAILMLALPFGVASAQETGLSGMHTQATLGNRICMTDHSHDGKGSGTTEAEARAAAAKNWSGFTEWEYGPAWGSYALANAKRERCEPEFGQIACYFVAYPCKARGGRAAPVAAPRKPAGAPRAANPRASSLKPRAPATLKVAAVKAKPQYAQPRAKIRASKPARPAPALKQALWSQDQKSAAFAQLR